MGAERRATVKRSQGVAPPPQRRSKSLPSGVKVVPISFSQVVRAYKKVRKNRGGAGVDGRTLANFEADLQGNLYCLWNRLTSGSYLASPVREVAIPKSDGGIRKLGIPTVEDRIAQQVIKSYLEPRLDRLFHATSYGYRSQKNAHQALHQVRRHCRRYFYCIDMDIKSFFDEVSHELLMKALRKHVSEEWVLRLITTWLRAPIQQADGKQRNRIGRGTPQGGVISPLLSNLFLHYVLDEWLARKYGKGIELVRYADDAVVFCRTAREAEHVLGLIRQRIQSCELRLHPAKTKIVHCKTQMSQGQNDYPVYFDFLGHRFQPRTKRRRDGSLFLAFDGAISPSSERRITEELRQSNFQRWVYVGIEVIAAKFNAKLRAWWAYYGELDRFRVRRIFERFNFRLLKWVIKKYRRFGGSFRKAGRWLRNLAKRRPNLFHHWKYGVTANQGIA